MKRIFIALLLLASAAPVLAGDAATVVGNVTLMSGPAGDAAGTVSDGALVTVGAREGGWYQVSLPDGRKGYLRISQVRFKEQEESESVFGGLWSWLNSSRQSTHGGSTTAGIRGMDEQDIAAAEPDLEAVAALDQLAVDEAAARKFAQKLSLKTRQVDELD